MLQKAFRFFTLGYSSHRIAAAYYFVILIILRAMLRFSDTYKSYDGRYVFVIVAAASLYGPPAIVCDGLSPTLPGSPTVDLENKQSATIYPFLVGRPPSLCNTSLLGFSEKRTSAILDSVESSPSH